MCLSTPLSTSSETLEYGSRRCPSAEELELLSTFVKVFLRVKFDIGLVNIGIVYLYHDSASDISLSLMQISRTNSIAPVVHNQRCVKRRGQTSNIDASGLQSKLPKRQSKKGRTTYESDDDAQIQMRLARLRRDVLEQQEDIEEEVVNENEQTDDALERLRNFRESLGIPEPQQRQHSTPKARTVPKRRYSTSDKHSSRKDFDTQVEMSEAQLLQRLQKLRQSLSSPDRSKTSKSQRGSKKKKTQFLPSSVADRHPTNSSLSAELFSAASENPQTQVPNMMHLQGVNPGLAKELHQHWSMDLNNVMHMGFAIEGGQVDQFVGHGDLHQYAQ